MMRDQSVLILLKCFSFGFYIWHVLHQEPQFEGAQGADLLLLRVIKRRRIPKKRGNCVGDC